MSKSETEKDICNVEAWAKVIERVLWAVPPDTRVAALMLTLQNEEAERKEYEANGGGLIIREVDDERYLQSAAFRYHDVIMRLKSLVIQVLTRDITNNCTPQKAKEI